MPSKHYYSTTCHDLNYACLHYAPSPRCNRSRVEKKEQYLLLLDRDGEIRFRQDQLTSGADLDLTGLLSALDELPDSILPVDRPVVC
jgi:hypothetical protein